MWPRRLHQLPGHASSRLWAVALPSPPTAPGSQGAGIPQCLLDTVGRAGHSCPGFLLDLQFNLEHVAVNAGSESANGDASLSLFQTDSGIQALFAGIDSLCKKYSKETSQVGVPWGRGPGVSGLTPRCVLCRLHCSACLLALWLPFLSLPWLTHGVRWSDALLILTTRGQTLESRVWTGPPVSPSGFWVAAAL